MKNKLSKNYIFICTSKDCKKNGSKQLIKGLSAEIKARDRRSSVEIIKTKCMGHCKKGPNIIIHDCLYHKVTSNDIKDLTIKVQQPKS